MTCMLIGLAVLSLVAYLYRVNDIFCAPSRSFVSKCINQLIKFLCISSPNKLNIEVTRGINGWHKHFSIVTGIWILYWWWEWQFLVCCRTKQILNINIADATVMLHEHHSKTGNMFPQWNAVSSRDFERNCLLK